MANRIQSKQASKTTKIQEENEEYDDELQDQMAESLFQEANQMGIFKIENIIHAGVDYAAALDNIESKIKENDAKREDKKLNNIKNVSIVLLVIAILLVVMSGYEIFSSRKSAGFTYYF